MIQFFILSDNPIIKLFPLKVIPLFIIYFLFLISTNKISLKINFKKIIFIYIITSALTSIYNNSLLPILICIISSISFLIIFNKSNYELRSIVIFLTKILLFFGTLSCFALLLSLFGEYYFLKLDYLYLYPFSFMYPNEPYMRPTGFFFEPGQFSFYICMCVICRELLDLERGRSFLLIAIGLITQSLAHIIFILFYFIYLIIISKKIRSVGLLRSLAFIFILFSIYLSGYMDWGLLRALEFFNDPHSWQRVQSMFNAYKILDSNITNYLFGPSEDYASRVFSDVIGENPLTPILFGGLLASWPYYLFLFYGLYAAIKHSPGGILLLAAATLTIQRPYTLEFPYTLMICLVLSIFLRYKSLNKNNDI